MQTSHSNLVILIAIIIAMFLIFNSNASAQLKDNEFKDNDDVSINTRSNLYRLNIPIQESREIRFSGIVEMDAEFGSTIGSAQFKESDDACSLYYNNTEYFTISKWIYDGEKFSFERPSNIPKHFEMNAKKKNQAINTAIDSLLISNISTVVEYQGNLSEITSNIGEDIDIFLQNMSAYVNASKNDALEIMFCGKNKLETEISAKTILTGEKIEDIITSSTPAKIRMAIPMFIFVHKN
jgi:hypothetical protein